VLVDDISYDYFNAPFESLFEFQVHLINFQVEESDFFQVQIRQEHFGQFSPDLALFQSPEVKILLAVGFLHLVYYFYHCHTESLESSHDKEASLLSLLLRKSLIKSQNLSADLILEKL